MKSVWIKLRHDGKFGTGTQGDPFAGEQFDAAIDAIKALATNADETVLVNILNGRFKTKGFSPGNNWQIQGQGIDVTVLALVDVGMQGFHHPDNYAISTTWYQKGLPWVNSFRLSDVTIDCQWPIQSARQTPAVKYGGVHVQAATALVERVRVINFGSNGLVPANSEAFPLYLVSYSDEATFLTIKDSIVELQHQYLGGYCAAFNITTIQTQAGGDRIPWGAKKAPAGLVTGCKAIGIDGSGFGVANAENVLFLDNEAVGCVLFANCDTGFIRNITYQNNRALHCNQGIHFGNAYSFEFTGTKILWNRFELADKWLNDKLTPPRFEFSYGVRLAGRTKGTLIAGNSFRSLYGLKTYQDGTYGVGVTAEANLEWTVNDNNIFTDIKDTLATAPPIYV